MIILATLSGAAFVTAFTLWFLGFAGNSYAASERLARIGGGNQDVTATPIGATLRKRASIRLGGINFVNANVAREWTLQLERAGLTLNAKEYLILRCVVGLVLAMVVALLVPFPLLALAAAPIGFLGVGFWLKRRIASRTRRMEAQLVELLQMVASGLRAGFGLVQALEHSADQLPAPISVELRRAMRDMAMGASVEQALTALNERVGSPDFDIVVTAILIQRSVGGNLAEILDNVAHTMRERERIRGEIRTLTSQQRMTGYVIGAIPVGLFIVFSLINPEYVGLLYTDPLGQMIMGAAIFLEVMGFLVIKRIVNIEV